MIAPAVHCDVCPSACRATNHWYQARIGDRRIIIEPYDVRSTRVKHLCGEACVAALVSRTLARWGLEWLRKDVLHAEDAASVTPPADEPIEFPMVASVCESAKTG